VSSGSELFEFQIYNILYDAVTSDDEEKSEETIKQTTIFLVHKAQNNIIAILSTGRAFIQSNTSIIP
jgi:hypothetical protein